MQSHLEALGYITLRSAGSHSAADIMAAKAGRLLLIQVKRERNLFSPEWNNLLTAARQAGAEAILVSAPLRGELVFERLTDFRMPLKKRRPCTEIVI